MTTRKRPLLATMVLALAMLHTGAARATLVRAEFTGNFHPPNPCIATDLGDLTGWTMEGVFSLFYRMGRTGDLAQQNLGPPDLPDAAPLIELGEISAGASPGQHRPRLSRHPIPGAW